MNHANQIEDSLRTTQKRRGISISIEFEWNCILLLCVDPYMQFNFDWNNNISMYLYTYITCHAQLAENIVLSSVLKIAATLTS